MRLPAGSYLSAEDYAQRVGMNVATVKRWCQRHQNDHDPRVFKFGKVWLIKLLTEEDS